MPGKKGRGDSPSGGGGLQDLVLRRLAELGLSYRQAAVASGGLVSYATLNQIARGVWRYALTDRTAKGLAIALDVSTEDVYAAAGVDRRAPSTVFKLPARANRLSPKERHAVITLIDALLDARGARD